MEKTDRALRAAKIEQNIGLVHACVHKFCGRGIEYEDLFQAGCMGLVKACDAFDEERGTRFSTYAVPVILGEIRRLFRDGGAVKVSRTIKELSVRTARERERLVRSGGREPTVSELAAALGESEEAVNEAICAGSPVLSLTQDDDEGGGQIDVPVDSPEECTTERLSVSQALEKLDERDRKLIALRYFKGKTQSETAALLSMTQVQVSRREKKILGTLRLELSG